MSESTSNKAGVIVIALSILAILLMLNSDKDPQAELDRVRKIQLDSEIERLDAIYNPHTAPTSSELISELDAMQDHFRDAANMIDPTPSPSDKPKAVKREVIMFSRSSCPPCEKWWRCERQRFEDAGYTVAICYDHDFAITPRFGVTDGTKSADIVGYMTLERLASELAK
jgi:hypothetical protein